MTPAIWQELATAVYKEITNGATGVIVTHGTDTMAYSAAAVSFMLDTPVPVVFVGSQRSADRPSSDNTMNAYAVRLRRSAVSGKSQSLCTRRPVMTGVRSTGPRGSGRCIRRGVMRSRVSVCPLLGMSDYPFPEGATCHRRQKTRGP